METTENLETTADGLIVRGRPPFAMTPTSLLRNPTISSHAVRLWSVLASYTYGDQATDRESRARLAADVGWKSVRSVDTHLTELQDAGYLTVQQRWRHDHGRARSLYILEWEPNTPSSATAAAPRRPASAAGQTPRAERCPGVRDQVAAKCGLPGLRRSDPCAGSCPWVAR